MTDQRYGEGGWEGGGEGNLICKAAAGRGGGLLLLLPALLPLHTRVQSVVRMLVSCGGAERIHIKQHGSDIYYYFSSAFANDANSDFKSGANNCIQLIFFLKYSKNLLARYFS